MAEDRPFFIALKGKLNTADKPIVVGQDFTELVNLIPDMDGLEGTKGMTKINSSNALDANHQHVQNAFHFKKSSPAAETHIIAQTVKASDDSAPALVENVTAIPSVGDFKGGANTEDLHIEDPSADIARFSDAPGGQVVVCDNKESLIWAGIEKVLAATILSSATIAATLTEPKDLTEKMANSSTDIDQLMNIGPGGNDSFAKLLIHGSEVVGGGTFTDSGDTGHTVSFVGTQTDFNSARAKFGGKSMYFDGTGDNITVPDHADFDISATDGGIDVWLRPVQGLSESYFIFHQDIIADATTYMLASLTKYTMLLLNGDVLTDASLSTKTVNNTGSVSIDTLNTKFNPGSLSFDGTNYLTITAHADFDYSAEDTYTIGMWIRPSSVAGTQMLFEHRNDANNLVWVALVGDTLQSSHRFAGNASSFASSSGTIAVDTWYHIVLVSDGTNVSLFLDETRIGTDVYTTDIIDLSGDAITIGAGIAGATKFTGLMEDVMYSSNEKYDASSSTLIVPTARNRNIAHSVFAIVNAGAGTSIHMTQDDITPDNFHHIEINYDVSEENVYMFTDGVIRSGGVANIGETPSGSLDEAFTIGGDVNGSSSEFKGWMDELRWTKGVLRHTANFTPKSTAYITPYVDFLVGSLRPLKAIKFYVKENGDNTETSTLTMKEWNGNSWSSVAIVDGTDSGDGISFGQTGSVSFASTVDTSKPRYIGDRYLYFYNFTLSAGEVDIYQITVDAPIQKVIDIWDGEPRTIVSYLIFSDSAYNDYTTNVALEIYDTGNEATFVTAIAPATGLNALLSTEYQLVGSLERLTALFINIIGGQGNEAAATLEVSYWDGAAWVVLTHVTDGTIVGGATYSKTGVVSWQVPDEETEIKVSISGMIPLYYYRVRATGNFSAKDIQVFHISGIPAQKRVGTWRFSLLADQCLWLCDDVNGKRNEVFRSAPNSPEAFNGEDSFRIRFGDAKRLTGALPLSLKRNDDITDIKLFWKKNEMYGLRAFEDRYRQFVISLNIGCAAPLTIDVILVSTEFGTVSAAIWQGSKGIYIWHGGLPKPIHWDIRNLFDPTQDDNDRKINPSYIDLSIGTSIDANRRYLYQFADGNSTGELNREYVLDTLKMQWSEVERSNKVAFTSGGYIDGGGTPRAIAIGDTITNNGETAEVVFVLVTSGAWATTDAAGDLYLRKKTGAFAAGAITIGGNDYATATADSVSLALQSTIVVEDATGNKYPYGFTDTGYMQRLEFGTSYDGAYIAYSFRTGHIALHKGEPMYESEVSQFNLVMATKEITSEAVTVIHYGDGNQVGTEMNEAFDPTKANFDFVGVGTESQNVSKGLFAYHSFKAAIATNDENSGFDPVAIGGFYQITREDKSG